MARSDGLAENRTTSELAELRASIRELKVGNQYLEAQMFESKTGASYDITGFMSGAGSGFALAVISVIVTATDGVTPFQATCTPEMWLPNLATKFEDTGITPFTLDKDARTSLDGLQIEFWFMIATRATVPDSNFYFKSYVYSTTPVSVSISRPL